MPFKAIAGIIGTINNGVIYCDCGATTFDVTLDAIPTDNYKVINGVVRREFVTPDGIPPCHCHNSIWLSDKDGPCTHPLFDKVKRPSAREVLRGWTQQLNELADALEQSRV